MGGGGPGGLGAGGVGCVIFYEVAEAAFEFGQLVEDCGDVGVGGDADPDGEILEAERGLE